MLCIQSADHQADIYLFTINFTVYLQYAGSCFVIAELQK